MICKNCGVEVEEKHNYCPLCLAPLGEEQEEGKQNMGPEAEAAPPALQEPPRETQFRAALWLIEAFSMVAGIAALVIFAADFAFSSEVGWSRYPLISIALVWAIAVVAVLLRRRFVLLIVASLFLVGGYTYFIDRFIGAPYWFVDVAVPNLLVLLLLAAGSVALIQGRRLRLLQTLSLLSFDVGLLLVVVEGSLQRYITGEIVVSWSILGFACLTAVAVVVFYLHRSVKNRHRDVRRYLHL